MIMNIVNNGYYMKSDKSFGSKTKCGCAEFTFDNVTWFTSRTKLGATIVILIFSETLVYYIQLQDRNMKLYIMSIIAALLLLIFIKMFFYVKKETLYVFAPIGVQFITTYLIGRESVLFIPWHSIRNFVIVEVIVGQRILFYLGLQNNINTSDGLVILFQNTRPRLKHLEEMYKIILEHTPGS